MRRQLWCLGWRSCLQRPETMQLRRTSPCHPWPVLLPAALPSQENKGFIQSTELKHVLGNIGESLSAQELDELVKEADPNNTGKILFDEVGPCCADLGGVGGVEMDLCCADLGGWMAEVALPCVERELWRSGQ